MKRNSHLKKNDQKAEDELFYIVLLPFHMYSNLEK